MANEINCSDKVIDSRDVIARIEELEGDLKSVYDETYESIEEAWRVWLNDPDTCDEDEPESAPDFDDWLLEVKDDSEHHMQNKAAELLNLRALAEQGEGYGDWMHGEQLIREDYFTCYIEQLIADCYELPKELTSGNWPYRHITVDYEAAAEEAKVDYHEVDFDGTTYLMRA